MALMTPAPPRPRPCSRGMLEIADACSVGASAADFTTSAGKIFHDGMDDPRSWVYPSNQTAWLGCGHGDSISLAEPNFCGVTNRSQHQYTDEDLALCVLVGGGVGAG